VLALPPLLLPTLFGGLGGGGGLSLLFPTLTFLLPALPAVEGGLGGGFFPDIFGGGGLGFPLELLTALRELPSEPGGLRGTNGGGGFKPFRDGDFDGPFVEGWGGGGLGEAFAFGGGDAFAPGGLGGGLGAPLPSFGLVFPNPGLGSCGFDDGGRGGLGFTFLDENCTPIVGVVGNCGELIDLGGGGGGIIGRWLNLYSVEGLKIPSIISRKLP